jgi:plasmid maintenance system antidote protein VapI
MARPLLPRWQIRSRLCRGLGLSPGYWLRAQAAYDTEVASAELADDLNRIQPLVGG